jgi:hypothetical protein
MNPRLAYGLAPESAERSFPDPRRTSASTMSCCASRASFDEVSKLQRRGRDPHLVGNLEGWVSEVRRNECESMRMGCACSPTHLELNLYPGRARDLPGYMNNRADDSRPQNLNFPSTCLIPCRRLPPDQRVYMEISEPRIGCARRFWAARHFFRKPFSIGLQSHPGRSMITPNLIGDRDTDLVVGREVNYHGKETCFVVGRSPLRWGSCRLPAESASASGAAGAGASRTGGASRTSRTRRSVRCDWSDWG